MGDLSTYQLSDFILFSGSTYYRLFELYNRALWPLHLVALLFIAWVLFAAWKQPRWGGRVIASVLVVSWLWTAYAFLYLRFYPIHVVANWYALAFVMQALLIAWHGGVRNQFALPRKSSALRAVGLTAFLVGVLVYPVLAAMTGRPWQQAEIFALAPDPTVVGTLGLLLFYRTSLWLFVLPVCWLIVTYTTQMVM